MLSSANARGALFMSVCMAGFAFNDALIKLVSLQIGLFQAIFLRGLFASALIGCVWWRSQARVGPLAPTDLRMMGWRLIGELGGTICFLTAIFHMPIANATAILQAMPLAVTLAAGIFLREKISLRRMLVIAIGFVGVLIIVRPGTSAFDHHAIWAVCACAFLVLRDMSTRQLSRAVPAQFVTFTTAVTITLMGGVVSLWFPWVTTTAWQMSALLIAAVFVLTGYFFGVLAMRYGDVSAVSPFRYSILIWASLMGAVFFDEWPDRFTIIGSIIVVLTGVYTIRQEFNRNKHVT